ncbi:YadA-like family protein [Burkholderia ubonensis]|uniref:YadA-like family protein n=1 Tax=Burkholderia ubonensis TaxID=101571 RepID=UPI0009B414BA|nr:YadA-like family protein [Burkholderia ubonensis]
MNKVYRVVWNVATGVWVAVDERVKSCGKSKSARSAATVAAIGASPKFTPALAVEKLALSCTASGSGAAHSVRILFASLVMAAAGVAVPSFVSAADETVLGEGASAKDDGSWSIKKFGNRRTDGLGFDITSDLGGVAATALGSYAGALELGATAVGSYSLASGIGAAAFGGYANAVGRNTLAFGSASYSSGVQSIALGSFTAAVADRSNALGTLATSRGVDANAIGTSADASGARSIAFGSAATVVTIGTANGADTLQNTTDNTAASGDDSIAIGTGTRATATGAMALGATASATANDGVALGSQSIANRASGQGGSTLSAVSVGSGGDGTATATRQIISVARGTQDTDAVNLSQLKGVTTALGGGATVNADGSIAAPTYKVDGKTMKDVGSAITSIDDSLTTLDGRVTRNETSIEQMHQDLSSGAVGLVQHDASTNSVTVARGIGGSVVDFTGAEGNRVLTGLANGKGDRDAVTIAQLRAVGLVDPEGRMVGALTYDDIELKRATLGGTSGTVLANVANGSISAGSMDAVNGSQLYAMQQEFENRHNGLIDRIDVVEQAVANGTGGNGSGNIGGDGSQATGENSTGLGQNANASGSGSAAIGQDSNASGSNSTAVGQGSSASGENAIALGQGSTASGKDSVALGQNSVADRENSVSVGSVGNERQITNVEDGTAPTDAVNVRQMNSALGSLRSDVEDYRRDSNAGTASAVAIANLPQAALPGESMVSVAGGTYAGQSAVAFGLSTATRNGKWVAKASGSTNTRGTVAVGAGVGYRW